MGCGVASKKGLPGLHSRRSRGWWMERGVMRSLLRSWSCRALLLACTCLGGSVAAHAMSLREAVSIALISNPQIGQAIQNREAIEFELRQARGLYLPRVD